MGVSPRVTTWLRAAGHDATHLREQGLHKLSDIEIFRKAAVEDRIVLMFDLDFAEIVARRGPHDASVIVFRVQDTRTDRVIERLRDVLEQSSDTLEGGTIIVVEDAHHRVRRFRLA